MRIRLLFLAWAVILVAEGNGDIFDYLATARDLEVSVLTLAKLSDRQHGNVASRSSKGYPNFEPPHAHVELEARRELEKAGTFGRIMGAVIGPLSALSLGVYSGAIAGYLMAMLVAAFGCLLGILLGGAIAKMIAKPAVQEEEGLKKLENFEARESWERLIEQEREFDRRISADLSEALAPLDDALADAKGMLEAHYQDGPIYQKYRTFPAVCRLYEYFDSGRFSSLGDAYNPYELEIRLDKQIDSSEHALAKLQKISHSQQLLYTALSDMQSSLDGLNAKLDACARDLDRVAYASEVTAICSA